MCRSLEFLGLGLCDSTCIDSNQAVRRRMPQNRNYFRHDLSKTIGSFIRSVIRAVPQFNSDEV